MTNIIKNKIEITSHDLEYSNPYVDFGYGEEMYRWYLNESKFSKLFGCYRGGRSKAVRGNERKAVFAELKSMVEKIRRNEYEKKIIGVVIFHRP